ncbi:hypothetical protein SK128_002975, partial [Halocaridina rubra]
MMICLCYMVYSGYNYKYADEYTLISTPSAYKNDVGRCKALFTVQDDAKRVLNGKYGIKLEENGDDNEENRENTSAEFAMFSQEKISNFSKLTTKEYTLLANLLPKVTTYKKVKDNIENVLKATKSEFRFLSLSRIDHAERSLPYVNCKIESYKERIKYSSCIRKRIETQGSLWIHFMGDSKIRELLYQFLRQTDEEYDYMIKHE